MKLCRYILLLIAVLLPFVAGATAQEPEKITINGEKWDMMVLPIETDSILSKKVDGLVKIDGWFSTGNYREYVGFWEIKENRLFLRGIRRLDEDFVDSDALKNVFAPYCTDEGILASWFSGEIRVGRGEWISWDDWDFNFNYEHECLITVVNGEVREKKCYDNYVEKGMPDGLIEKHLEAVLTWNEFRDFKEEEINVVIKDIVLDDSANLVDCNLELRDGVKNEITDQNDVKIGIVKDVLKTLSPWAYAYINGEKVTYIHFINVYHEHNLKKNVEARVNDIYRQVEAMAKSRNMNCYRLVDKYCSWNFRRVFHSAYDSEPVDSTRGVFHWLRSNDYVTPEFKVKGIGIICPKESNARVVNVSVEKRDVIDGKPVVQEFFLKMIPGCSRWLIDDIRNSDSSSDRHILKKMKPAISR